MKGLTHHKEDRKMKENSGPNREYVLVGRLNPADLGVVCREALRVLRPTMDAAHLDAYSDDAFPPAVLHSYHHALLLARKEVADGIRSRRADPGMGIDINIRDDGQFAVLSDLAPHTIHAECSQNGRLIFSVSDSGTSLYISVTKDQEAEFFSRLDALGIPSSAFAAHHGLSGALGSRQA